MASSEGPSEVPLGTYIFERIRSLGIDHVFGVPGDFNLNLLDHMSSSNLQWVGTCNELNAAYAADGYARVRGLPGVLITTYGVGELSAINGIAGAYAEHVPIIHIVGMTSRLQQRARMMIHHTLGQQWDSADHSSFMDMSKPVRTDSVFLDNDEDFAEGVDRVIASCFRTRRPVYIYVPMDTPDILIPAHSLKTPLDIEIRNTGKQEEEEQKVVHSIMSRLKDAKSPTVLVDVLARRYGLEDEVMELLKITNLPAFTTPLSKAFVDETSPNFVGIYVGQMTPNKNVKTQLETSDAVLYVGPLPSDSATGGFSYGIPAKAKITLHSDFVSIGEEKWEGLHFVPVLKRLVAELRAHPLGLAQAKPHENATATNGKLDHPTKSLTGPLQQHHFWKCFEPYLQEGDCIIAEVGTAQFATYDLSLPPKAEYFTQIFYSCIGFTVGALLGALVARREQGHTGRTILFVGDGSLQMTVQELGTIIRQGFHPTIILINNSGYTVERVIHGPTRAYNDISESWDYQNMLKFFGGASSQSRSYTARTYEELHSVLETPEFAASEHIQLLEAFMDKYDAPWNMLKLVQVGSERAAAGLKKWDEECGRKRVVKDTNLMQSKYVLKDSPSYRKAVE